MRLARPNHRKKLSYDREVLIRIIKLLAVSDVEEIVFILTTAVFCREGELPLLQASWLYLMER
jgi:hypothetical protein